MREWEGKRDAFLLIIIYLSKHHDYKTTQLGQRDDFFHVLLQTRILNLQGCSHSILMNFLVRLTKKVFLIFLSLRNIVFFFQQKKSQLLLINLKDLKIQINLPMCRFFSLSDTYSHGNFLQVLVFSLAFFNQLLLKQRHQENMIKEYRE